jgi:2-amino-4-hydroxy-6-hydroxymethyldihydropteridine diphosphokinase
MNKAYLLTGGNTGDRREWLQKATSLIEATCGNITKQSSLFETAAWGKTDQPAFLNQALLLHTKMEAPELMHELLRIEEQLGRKRVEKYGARIIDIDILLFNDAVIDTSLVRVPHPELPNRRFALEPLCELAPNFIHPVLQKTIAQLLKDCTDRLPVKKLR